MTIKQIKPSFSFRRILIVFLSLHLFSFSGLVNSSSVYIQPALDGGDGVEAFTPEEYADDFSLVSNARVTGIKWWGSFFDAATASAANNIFDIMFYDDNAGLPGALLNSFNVDATRNTTALLDTASEPVFRFDALSLAPFSLLENETYYVSITHSDGNFAYFWLESDSSGSYFNQNSTANLPWVEIAGNNNLAFNLVPEPTMPMLFSIAILFSALHRRLLKA